MPIVLALTGQIEVGDRKLSLAQAREWLARAAVWFEGVGDAVLDARLMRAGDEKPVLLVDLRPTSPAVEIRLGASGKVRVTATTTPAGPGYHQYLCRLLRQLAADFGLSWIPDDCTDPTGYFASNDRGRVEQHFLRWLAGTCAEQPRSIGLPPGYGFTHPGEVLTPLGPQSKDWMNAVVADPNLGRDFFPWWEPELDPAFYRNRAVARLWSEFPWRAPLTEAEGETADQIANDLATAFKLDPGTELPWSEWLELLAAIQEDAIGEQFCVTPTDTVLSVELWKRTGPVKVGPEAPRIGYRRHPVRVVLDGGWSVEVPGTFTQEWDNKRNWTAWDRTRTVCFRRVGYTKPDGSAPSATEALELGRRTLPEGETLPALDEGQVTGNAVFGPTDEDGRTLWRLSGVAGAPGQLAVCYVYTESASDRDWAVHTWQSLRLGTGV